MIIEIIDGNTKNQLKAKKITNSSSSYICDILENPTNMTNSDDWGDSTLIERTTYGPITTTQIVKILTKTSTS